MTILEKIVKDRIALLVNDFVKKYGTPSNGYISNIGRYETGQWGDLVQISTPTMGNYSQQMTIAQWKKICNEFYYDLAKVAESLKKCKKRIRIYSEEVEYGSGCYRQIVDFYTVHVIS
jgi:hypothetical protein